MLGRSSGPPGIDIVEGLLAFQTVSKVAEAEGVIELKV